MTSLLTGSRIRVLVLAVLILPLSPARAQDDQHKLATLYGLRDRGDWQQILDATAELVRPDSQQRFLRGLALAHLGQLPEAEVELKQAAAQAGKRSGEILIELAGVQFKQRRYGEASKNLHRAISVGDTDPYVFNFLASLYYLEGNLEAAVKYWNLVGKPGIQGLKVEPEGILDPVLMDRALAMSPSSELKLRSLRLTDRRLELLGIFARRRYDLAARQDGRFDLTIQTAEKADLRADSRWSSMIMVAREIPFRTLNADVRNIRRSAVNWSSTFRWKFGNHLFASRLSAPLGRNPNLLYQADVTVRDEEWNLSGWGLEGRPTRLKLVETKADITSIAGDRWSWSTGVAVSHRTVSGGLQPVTTPASGFALASTWGARYDFLRVPERRIKVSGEARWELGRFWDSTAALFSLGEVAIDGSWKPQKEERLVISARALTGRSAGSIPFDRLFRLGMDRDSDLLLRGHTGTRDGLKGNGPMGGGYLLSNVDVQTRLYRNGLLSFSAGPFLDSGKILDARSNSGRLWMWDTGLEGRLAFLGLFQLAVSYGLDTRSGDRLVFWRVLPQ
ncbi:MAG: hypothetical protein EHM23_29965 [Acidobacteria bacterium]|nr:MAG: hypothetical protein EHM23_29965 [Acidobacteriota bacterium]